MSYTAEFTQEELLLCRGRRGPRGHRGPRGLPGNFRTEGAAAFLNVTQPQSGIILTTNTTSPYYVDKPTIVLSNGQIQIGTSGLYLVTGGATILETTLTNTIYIRQNGVLIPASQMEVFPGSPTNYVYACSLRLTRGDLLDVYLQYSAPVQHAYLSAAYISK